MLQAYHNQPDVLVVDGASFVGDCVGGRSVFFPCGSRVIAHTGLLCCRGACCALILFAVLCSSGTRGGDAGSLADQNGDDSAFIHVS
jgi:hypothetical protein